MGFPNTKFQLCFSYLLIQVMATPRECPIITVAEGRLRGIEQISRDGNRICAYLSIPYAVIPARFEPPQPSNSWDGIRDATKFGPVCPQLMRGTNSVIGEEECLYLNVFTGNHTGNLPVIVYIHGGALMTGSGHMYGGSYFLDQNVVLITINYRLGAFGFLSTGDGVVQGNNGLRDQTAALKWVKANAKALGGNELRVVIMGESAGSACVSYHVLSPMSKGLFQAAIMQSGSALDPEHFESDPLSRAVDLAEGLGCPTFSTVDMADCLRTIDFKKIVQMKLTKWHLDPLVAFPPTIDVPRPGQLESELFLTEPPLHLLQEGRLTRVPIVIGVTEEEGLLFHSAYILRSAELQRSMNEDWNYVAPITFYYDNQYIPGDERDQISRKIRGFYFGDRKVESGTSRNLTNLYSDRLFNWGTRTAALLMAKYAPVYTYIFGFLGDFSMLQLFYSNLFQGPIATTHGDDLQYFFNSTRYPLLRKSSRAEQISRILIQLWSSFASSGNMMKSLDTLRTAWLPVGPEEIRRKRLKWCYIDIESKIINRDPFGERMEFWDKISTEIQNFTYRPTSISSRYKKESTGKNKDEF